MLTALNQRLITRLLHSIIEWTHRLPKDGRQRPTSQRVQENASADILR